MTYTYLKSGVNYGCKKGKKNGDNITQTISHKPLFQKNELIIRVFAAKCSKDIFAQQNNENTMLGCQVVGISKYVEKNFIFHSLTLYVRNCYE